MSRHEQWLRNALAELMEVDPAQVSLTRTFAEQGIDSLLGLRLTRKLADRLGTEVELEWIFDNPSIAELSRFLDERFGDRVPASTDTDPASRISA
jgi:acyl carrier protein